jgi:hypothetical protein
MTLLEAKKSEFPIGSKVVTTMGVRRKGTITKPFHWKQSDDGTYKEPGKGYHPVQWSDGTKGYHHKHHMKIEENTDMTLLETFEEFLSNKEFETLQEAFDTFVSENEISEEDAEALQDELGDLEDEDEEVSEPEENDDPMGSLVDLAATEKPSEFAGLFAELMKNRVADAVADAKSEIADGIMEGKSWKGEEGARKSWKDKDRDSKRAGKKKDPEDEANEEVIGEAMTRKHFQMAADTIKQIEDPKKRKEHAEMHAITFAKSNPRFDHHRFYKACGVKGLNEGKSGDSEDNKNKLNVWRTRQNKRREKEEKNAESGEA